MWPFKRTTTEPEKSLPVKPSLSDKAKGLRDTFFDAAISFNDNARNASFQIDALNRLTQDYGNGDGYGRMEEGGGDLNYMLCDTFAHALRHISAMREAVNTMHEALRDISNDDPQFALDQNLFKQTQRYENRIKEMTEALKLAQDAARKKFGSTPKVA